MAKLLTKIWKTFNDRFFETEEEALESERQYNFKKLWIDLASPYHEKYHKEYQEYRNMPYELKKYRSEPRNPMDLPTGFLDSFYEKLKEGLLAPIVTSEKVENNS